jgi:hypothetical protein
VLGALKAAPSWFISDHLLRRDSFNYETAEHLRYESGSVNAT